VITLAKYQVAEEEEMEEETEFCLMEKQERKEVVAEPDVVIGRALNI